MLRLTRPTLLLFCATALFPACDEGSDAPDNEFRDGIICLTGVTPPSTTITNKGFPHPDDPKSLWIQIATENADELMFTLADLLFDMEAECKAACAVEDLDWTGDPCIGERDYKFDNSKYYETEEGDPRYSVDITTGDSKVGCVCK
jgi:hypothetical protein